MRKMNLKITSKEILVFLQGNSQIHIAMEKIEERLIQDALRQARLTKLPKAATKNTVWLEGIAKIRKANNSVAYGIVRRNPDLTHSVTYVNGDIFSITGIEEVYPYVTLDKSYIKTFDNKDKEAARINYLKSLNLPSVAPVNYDDMTMEELNKEVVKAAIYLQLKDMEKEAR